MGNCGSNPQFEDYFVDIEHPTSTNQDEINLATEIDNAFNPELMNRFENYHDAQDKVGIAISNPTEEANNEAWDAVIPLVRLHSNLHEYAKLIASKFGDIISYFYQKNGNRICVSEMFEDQPLLMNSLAKIADEVFKFDSYKMNCPKLLGDLSFFRRIAPRRSYIDEYEQLYADSSEMTLFFANPSPLFNMCVDKLREKYSNESDSVVVLSILASITDALTATELYHKFDKQELNIKCMKGMTFALLLYDHFSLNGAFQSKSPIHLKECLNTLSSFSPKQKELISTVKFSSKHFSDESTPTQYKTILK